MDVITFRHVSAVSETLMRTRSDEEINVVTKEADEVLEQLFAVPSSGPTQLFTKMRSLETE